MKDAAGSRLDVETQRMLSLLKRLVTRANRENPVQFKLPKDYATYELMLPGKSQFTKNLFFLVQLINGQLIFCRIQQVGLAKSESQKKS